jgi:lauroyl/myristoyl acyltransferase
VSQPAVVRAFRAAAALARVAPEPVAMASERVFGVGAALVARNKRRVVERNLRRVLGPQLHGRELRRLINATFASYARYYIESFRLPSLSPQDVRDGLTTDGYEHVDAALASGIGPILALPHLGGWEWAAFWLTLGGQARVTAVAEALEPPELFEWFTELRTSLGMEIVELGGDAGSRIMRAIRDRRVVCLLCDRLIGDGAGVEVEFFGERTLLPAGPATLALRTGAPLLPTAVYFRGDRHFGVVRPPVPATRQGRLRDDVTRVTQALAYELEGLIRVAPEQWHLMQPNWPSDRALFGQH